MKTMFRNAIRTKALAVASLFCAGSLQAQFIDLNADNVKVVFKTVDVVNSAGETVSASQATVSVVSTDASGTITSKEQTFVQVPDGSGGTEQIVEQVTTTATVDAFTGNYAVEAVSKKRTTPVEVDADGDATATASTKVSTTIADLSNVKEEDLDLPPTTTFTVVSDELETPVVISKE
jgi:hypothetical protein